MDAADARGVLAERCRTQAGWCRKLGSSLYGKLLELAAEDLETQGAVWRVLEGWEKEPEESYVPLRLMGGVHRLVLTDRANELAAHYPSVGGTPGPDVWDAFRGTVEEHREKLRGRLAEAPQTNEVGRSAVLLGGFLDIVRRTSHPLRLLELGASAGLNLRWDSYRYEAGSWAWGDPASRLRFQHAFEAQGRPIPVDVHVVERRGCDLLPLDPTSEDDRLTLLSYIWPDQVERVQRLRAALEIAQYVPVDVERADAVTWARRELGLPAPGVTTVAYHSIFIGYLDEASQAELVDVIEAAGQRAGNEGDLAWLRFEREGDRFELRLRMWPGGEDRLLALAPPHGLPVTWLA